MVAKIDPRSPGQSTQSDDFCDPHGHIGSMANSGHENLGRGGDGSFTSLPRGGVSEDGDRYVEKYRPKGGSRPGSDIPSGANLNDEGDGYAANDGDEPAVTVDRNIVSRR
jgi:hypothetical protein